MQSLSRGCATFVAEFVQKLQSLWQSELRLAESAAESLRVCQVLCRVSAEPQENERECPRLSGNQLDISSRENTKVVFTKHKLSAL